MVGAGISKGSGLPEWLPLIKQTAAEAFSGTSLAAFVGLLDGRLNPLVSVRFLEYTLGLKAGFRSLLTRELYRNLDIAKTNANLDAVCHLVLGNGTRAAIHEVITYNFDDLFERRLKAEIEKRGLPLEVCSIYSDETYRKARPGNAISIYHVHGFLPSGADWEEAATNPIVFSEPDFHATYFDPLYWANEVQRRAFVLEQCLFVGLSMTDPNLRRLLDQAERFELCHFGFLRVDPSTLQNATGKLETFVRKADLESLKITPLWIVEYEDVATTLREISAL